MLNVKILSIQYPERYVVRRMVAMAFQELQSGHPGLEMNITEIGDPGQICKYAFVIVLPTLVINEKVVCTGRFPTKEEVAAWLREAV
ncbi:MAG: hypothetical protein FD146_51 [Anaerolineaceae bacterium]|nr:MAG: hypothetical protein FD146_51 [Anaerolineaceae bacterium]